MEQAGTETFQIGDYFLGKRDRSPVWYRCWYDKSARRQQRASLGTTEFEEAKEALTDWYIQNHRPQDATPDDILIADIIRRYYEDHAQYIPSADQARISLNLWLDFFTTSDLHAATRPAEIDRFIASLEKQGHSPSYISRTLSAGRAAIRRAWKQGEIASAPFIKDVAIAHKPPRGRPLDLNEIRWLYHKAKSDHVQVFILWMLGTVARPDAVLDLQADQIDVANKLVHLNPEGRPQTKKHRPTVKLPDQLLPFVPEEGGYVVNYHARRVRSIKKAWRQLREACGLDDAVNPYSLRHTMARHLRAAGVPAWEVSAQLGHAQPGMTTTEIYAPYSPDYLENAVIAIDSFLADVLKPPSEMALAPLSRHIPLKGRVAQRESTTLTS